MFINVEHPSTEVGLHGEEVGLQGRRWGCRGCKRTKSGPKIFRASLGKFGQKSFASPKICLLLQTDRHLYLTSEKIIWRARGIVFGSLSSFSDFGSSRNVETVYDIISKDTVINFVCFDNS